MFLRAFIAAFLGVFWNSGMAHAGVLQGGPQELSQVSSIGEVLANAGPRAVHILYIHGIGAKGAGDSKNFQHSVCAFLKDCQASETWASRDYADSGQFAPAAAAPDFRYLGREVWRDAENWAASAPFVDHYLLKRRSGQTIVVDEINWWPLVFALKCREILDGEAHLAGPNGELLDLCSAPTKPDNDAPGRFRSYSWITDQDAKRLKALPTKAALLNRDLKDNLLDWGFSDAIMAVGAMHDLFREGMRQLFVKSARFKADGSKTDDWMAEAAKPGATDREFIVVSHSLGSYLVFSTLNTGAESGTTVETGGAESGKEDAAARYILARTSLVYFFANQVALLELANVERPRAASASTGAPPTGIQGVRPASFGNLISAWKQLRQGRLETQTGGQAAPSKPPQIIAWSDPSDLLSWYVPSIDGVIVVNLYVHNAFWRWLFESPTAAHDNYATNGDVIRIILGPPQSK